MTPILSMSFWPQPLRRNLSDAWLGGLKSRITEKEQDFRTIGLLISGTQKETELFLNGDIEKIFERHCSGPKGKWLVGYRIYEEDEYGTIWGRIADFREWPFTMKDWVPVKEPGKRDGIPYRFESLMTDVDDATWKETFRPEAFSEDTIILALEMGSVNSILKFRKNVNGIIGQVWGAENYNF